MGYSAIVARVYVRPHPNADRLQIGDVLGNQVIVGKDTLDGELGIYFPADGQLSVEFATANDLVRRKNEDGTYSGGMFDNNRRVRAMNLRGVKSDGFWCPMSYLDNVVNNQAAKYSSPHGDSFLIVPSLNEGDTLTSYVGVTICGKYETPATIRAKAQKQATSAKKLENFPEHVDSEQFRYAKNEIPSGALITITEKLHGTSGRYGHVRVARELSWLEKIAKLFGVKVQDTEHKYVIGTRRTVLKDNDTGTSFYGDESFRRNAVHGITLDEGEIIYFELVGYTTTGNLIMAEQDTAKLGKEFVKQYGPRMQYTYGCVLNECKLFVYRITKHGVEYSWSQVQKRCKELGLTTVPTLSVDVYKPIGGLDMQTLLEETVNDLMIGASTLDPTHIREGVVVRVDSEHGTRFLKSKSTDFGILEGYLKEKPDYIDTEEIA